MNLSLARPLALGLALALPGAALADGWPTLEPLASSVADTIGTCNGRLQSTAQAIEIRAKRLTRLMGGGKALYSKMWDKVLLDPNILVNGKLRSLAAWSAVEDPLSNVYPDTATVYHEMGHAEFDHFIEQDATTEDTTFYKLLQDDVIPWLDDNETAADEDLIAEEWVGNYRKFVLIEMLGDVYDVLFANGVLAKTMTIDAGLVRGSLRKGLKPTDFGKFSAQVLAPRLKAKLNTPYKDRLKSLTFGVKKTFGIADISTSNWTSANGFEDAWWDALWDHFDHFHCLRDNLSELITFMNGSQTTLLAQLRAARLRAWRAQGGGAGGGAAGATGSVGASGSGEDLLGQDDEDD